MANSLRSTGGATGSAETLRSPNAVVFVEVEGQREIIKTWAL